MKAIKGVIEGVIEVFRWENLELDDPAPAGSGKPSFLVWLLKPESLPRPAVSVPPQKTSFLNWLLLPEKLPPPPDESSPRRPSLLAVLAARETLPTDPAPGKASKGKN
jgi:hypothetical protein